MKKEHANRLEQIEQREVAAKIKIDAIRAEKRRLQNREREKERKARTKRLIEIGAVMEHVLGRPIEHGDLPALQEAIEQLEHIKDEQGRDGWLSASIFCKSSLEYIVKKSKSGEEPNFTTYAAMEDAENGENVFGPYDSVEEMMQALEQDDEENS